MRINGEQVSVPAASGERGARLPGAAPAPARRTERGPRTKPADADRRAQANGSRHEVRTRCQYSTQDNIARLRVVKMALASAPTAVI